LRHGVNIEMLMFR